MRVYLRSIFASRPKYISILFAKVLRILLKISRGRKTGQAVRKRYDLPCLGKFVCPHCLAGFANVSIIKTKDKSAAPNHGRLATRSKPSGVPAQSLPIVMRTNRTLKMRDICTPFRCLEFNCTPKTKQRQTL